MEHKRARLASGLLLAAVFGVFAWRSAHPSEPLYEGKPLSYWLKRGAASWWTADNTSVQLKAAAAVRLAGTNAVPVLLRMLRRKDSLLASKLHTLARQQHLFKIVHAEDILWNDQGAEGFRALGPAAKDAVPDLIRIYEQRISERSQTTVCWALGFIGPDARAAVPSLLRALGDTNHVQAPYYAVEALGRIHAKPEVVVPALIRALDDPGDVRVEVIEALGEFGPDARPAVPAIVMDVRRHREDSLVATEALKRIDPAAMAQVVSIEAAK
jgi:hypothetical protein